jgi:DNA-binding Xre family transcriptional regulator
MRNLNLLEHAALEKVNLSEFARQSGVSYRQLHRIKQGKTRQPHKKTLEKIRQLLPQPLPYEAFLLSLLREGVPQRSVISGIFESVCDPFKTGLNVHQKMVERSLTFSKLMRIIYEHALGVVVHKPGTTPRPGMLAWDEFWDDKAEIMVDLIMREDGPDKVGWRAWIRKEGTVEPQPEGILINSQRINDIVLEGVTITFPELLLIASALRVSPGELLAPKPEGLEGIRNALKSSLKDSRLNDSLNKSIQTLELTRWL